MALDPKLRTAKESTLFTIGVVVSAVAYLALVISVVGALYALFIGAFLLIAQALFLAQVKGNGVRVSERQLPELYARVKLAASKLGVTEVPDVYLVQSGGVLNAFATKLLSRNFIILYSSLVDACEDPRQLDFVIGHEVGHLAAGHLKWNLALAPFRLVPWLGAAYSRAREYTCDRCGFAVAGDVEQSVRGLAVLAAGGRHAGKVDLAAFVAQREEAGNFWMAIYELVATHPYLCKRAAAVQEFAAPGTVKEVGRNPWAYPFAPIFGVMAAPASGAGGLIVVVAIMGVLAAVAIPAFVKYQERARLGHAVTQTQDDAPADDADDAALQRQLEKLRKEAGER